LAQVMLAQAFPTQGTAFTWMMRGS